MWKREKKVLEELRESLNWRVWEGGIHLKVTVTLCPLWFSQRREKQFLWRGAIYVDDAVFEEPRPAALWPYCWWLKCLSGFIDLCRSASALHFSILSTLFQERHLVVKHVGATPGDDDERKCTQLMTLEDFTVFDQKHGNVCRFWVGGALQWHQINDGWIPFSCLSLTLPWLTGTLEWKRATVNFFLY